MRIFILVARLDDKTGKNVSSELDLNLASTSSSFRQFTPLVLMRFNYFPLQSFVVWNVRLT